MSHQALEYVFVYGTLKRGECNHHWLDGAAYIDSASTVEQYVLYAISYPFLFDGEALYPVEGELYAVSPAGLRKLDELEQHPDDYCRKQIAIRCTDGSSVQAWAYFHPAPQGQRLSNGVFSGS